MIAALVWRIRSGHVCRCRTHPKQLGGKPEFHLLLDSGKHRYLDQSETTQRLKHVAVVADELVEGGADDGDDRPVALHVHVDVTVEVRDVEETLVLSTILVVLVVFLFLRNVRATLVPAVSVPLSVLARAVQGTRAP